MTIFITKMKQSLTRKSSIYNQKQNINIISICKKFAPKINFHQNDDFFVLAFFYLYKKNFHSFIVIFAAFLQIHKTQSRAKKS